MEISRNNITCGRLKSRFPFCSIIEEPPGRVSEINIITLCECMENIFPYYLFGITAASRFAKITNSKEHTAVTNTCINIRCQFGIKYELKTSFFQPDPKSINLDALNEPMIELIERTCVLAALITEPVSIETDEQKETYREITDELLQNVKAFRGVWTWVVHYIKTGVPFTFKQVFNK